MKKLTTTLAALLLMLAANAQKINYSVKKDDPSIAPWLSLNLDLFDMEIPFSSTTAAVENTSFNLGVWGHVEVPKLPFGVHYSYRQNWFVIGAIGNDKMPGHVDANLGAHLFFTNGTKTKPIKVSLKSETYTEAGKDITKETYIMVDGKRRTQLGVRGGFYLKNSGISLTEDEPTPLDIETAQWNSSGFYTGLLNRRTTNLVVDTDKFGLASKASKATNIYLDALVGFSNSFENIADNADVSDEVKDFLGGFPIGARLGYQVYQVEKREVTGKMFGLSARGEFGYRPYYGPYLAASIGLTLIKAQ